MSALVTVGSNNLQFNKEALSILQVSAGDRITVQYWNVDNETTYPLIGKADIFELEGNLLRKSNSISYRGQQRDILLLYGKEFTLEPFKIGFRMIPTSNNN